MAYTITFDKNGGIGSVPSSITTDAAVVTLPSTHPTYLRGAELYNINFDANGGKINGNKDNI